MSYVDATAFLGSTTVHVPQKITVSVYKTSGHSGAIYVEIGSNLTLRVLSDEALDRLIAGLTVARENRVRRDRIHWFYTEDSADSAA